MSFPPPTAFGLPAHFETWRSEQLEAIERMTGSKCRFNCHAMPTGSGKSLFGVGIARMTGWRTVYLTSTKGLQYQVSRDFGGCGLVDMRGQSNYQCGLLEDEGRSGTCDRGPCHAGYACDLKAVGCKYYDALFRARLAPLVVTNYAYWILQNKYGDGIGKFDCVILDEAHGAPDDLSSALSFEFVRADVEALLGIAAPWDSENVEDWTRWAVNCAVDAQADALEDAKRKMTGDHRGPELRRVRELSRLGNVLEDLATIKGRWIAECKVRGVSFSPVWPSHHAHRLFLDIPHVLLLSATVRPKTASLLGIGDSEMEFWDYDSVFPVSTRPVIYIPTVRMRYDMDESERRLWLARIDQIIDRRLDRKGIIHTVSYARRDYIVTHSRHRHLMFSHDTSNTANVVERFKRADAPAVLVSPSVSTGWDFPDDECRYSVCSKIAFPDSRDKIIEARCKEDKDYSLYLAMQELVQACGRGTRSETDFSESFILDDNWKWIKKRAEKQKLIPKWFLQACRISNTVPEPGKG